MPSPSARRPDPGPSSAPTSLDGRAAWESFASQLLEAAWKHASPSGSLIDLPGPASASGRWSTSHEGFTRTFLAAAFGLHGSGGADPHGWAQRYARGLAAGVDPDHAERWPTIAERRQSVPEAASLAIALSETKPWLWDQLPSRTREQTVEYLAGVVGTAGYTNNWTWFQTVIEAFLAQVGGPWSQDDLDRNEAIQESLYIGDGWYSDGAGPTGTRQNFDYYAGWAWHVYPLLHARIQGRDLSAQHRERLAAYVGQAIELIGSKGAPVLQGRSLTYRFAVLAPFWAAAIAGAGPLAAGEVRTLAERVMRYFLDAGAVDENGLLSIGWHGRFLPLRQLYTGSGSVYWASKGFLGLLLPADHPEWTRNPPEPPVEPVRQRALRAPGWIVVRTHDDGVVRVINHGTDGERHSNGLVPVDRPLYQRMAYSNVTAPDLSPEGTTAPRESHTCLLDAEGQPSHRGRIQTMQLSSRLAVSRSRVHWVDLPGSANLPDNDSWAGQRRGPILTTASVVHGPYELRLAWHQPARSTPHPSPAEDADAVWPADPGPWRIRFYGWQLPVDDVSDTATAEGIRSSVLPVRAIHSSGSQQTSAATPFSRASRTPWAQTSFIQPGQVAAALVVLAPEIPQQAPHLQVAPGRVTVTWPDSVVDEVEAEGVLEL
ncbi:DUF2264 domain-containing protein [Kineosporia babensis]|uniref:DUF2264 domain-containing protein n=1 Tax=Kineosporia babensis TaxID=499548 RepID=A0A9X1SSX6_9ACTN|nr:DUF2264 domain-containing protein [Kineosporia babensis]MCD5311049.1 DUF2264 domain-containing protein [Kineosporia babensis]